MRRWFVVLGFEPIHKGLGVTVQRRNETQKQAKATVDAS